MKGEVRPQSARNFPTTLERLPNAEEINDLWIGRTF